MDDESGEEQSFDELFKRLPTSPLPTGFREAVMARVARDRRRSTWEVLVATVLAVPNLIFLTWELGARGDEFGAALSGMLDAVGGEGAVNFYVDGVVVLSVALLGMAGLLMTHAALAARPAPVAAEA